MTFSWRWLSGQQFSDSTVPSQAQLPDRWGPSSRRRPPAVPRQPGSRLPAAPLPQPEGAPAPPQLSGCGLRRGPEAGSCRGLAGRTAAHLRVRSRGWAAPGLPEAVPERHFGAVSARCPPARRSARRGALPGSRGERALPRSGGALQPFSHRRGAAGGPAPRLTSDSPLAPLHRRLPLLPSELPALRRVSPLPSTTAFPAGRCSPASAGGRFPERAGCERRPGAAAVRSGPARRGEPGAGGSPGPTAALELTRVLMRRRGPARPAQHIPACPRPPGMRRLGSGPKSDLRWRFGRSALLASFFGERALK